MKLRYLLRMGDKQRLILTLSLLLALGFAAAAWVNYTVSSQAIRQSIVAAELPLTADNLYSEIQKDLVRPVVISSMMATDTFVRDWVLAGEEDEEVMIKYLREVRDRYGAFTSFFVSERSRTYYQTEGVLKRVREGEARDAWYFRVRAMSVPYEINVDPDLANKDAMTIFINYRVLDYNKKFLGAIGVGIKLDAAREIINRYQQRYGRCIYFVDRQGTVTLVGEHPGINVPDIHAVPGLGAIADTILGKGNGSFQYLNAAGEEQLLTIRLLPELNWFLFVEGTADAALEDIRRNLYVNFGLCLAITLIVVLVTSFTINRYQDRVESLITIDKLTGLANRQGLDMLIRQAMLEAVRSRDPLSALFIEVPEYKAVYLQHGPVVADVMLQGVANTLRDTLRASDIVARWSGNQFLVLLKNVAPENSAKVADKLRTAIAQGTFGPARVPVRTAIRVGAGLFRGGDTPEELVARAEEACRAGATAPARAATA